jgi:hypothetical protein
MHVCADVHMLTWNAQNGSEAVVWILIVGYLLERKL